MNELSELGHEQALALVESFKDKLKKAADDVIRDLYCDILPHIETDAWLNFRNHALDAIRDYPSLCSYDTDKIRQALLEKHRDAIIADINTDLMKENEQLKQRNQELRDQISERRY